MIARTSTANEFVQALLAADAEELRRLSIDAGLSQQDFHSVVLRLYTEAQRLIGVDPQKMERIAVTARSVANQSGEPFLQATALHSYADALRFQGRNTEAVTCFDEAAAIFNANGKPEEAARTRIGWAWVVAALGRPDEALQAARSARRVLVAHGLTLRVAALDMTLAFILDEHGRHREALRYFSSALSLHASLGEASIVGQARARAGRGRVLTRLGRYREGLGELEAARDVFLAQEARRDAVVALQAIGEHHLSLGHYTAAIRSFEQARPIVQSLGLDRESMMLARHLADCYLSLARPRDVIAALDEVDSELARSDIAQMTLALASRRVAALIALGEEESALQLLDEATHSVQSGALQHRAWLATQRASVLVNRGAVEEALVAAGDGQRFAGAAGLRRLEAEALILQGRALLAQGQLTGASGAAERARRLASKLKVAPVQYRSSELLGLLAERTGDAKAATRHYKAAIHHGEREQSSVIFEFRESFAVGRGLPYERLAGLQIDANCPQDALATVDRAKSRALTEVLAGTVQLRPRGSAEVRKLTRDLAAARDEYAAISMVAGANAPDENGSHGEAVAKAEARITHLTQRLQISSAPDGLADLYGQPLALEHASFPTDMALIEFFTAGQDLIRFVVSSDGVRAERVEGSVPELQRLVRAFRLNLNAVSQSSSDQQTRLLNQARVLLKKLYDILLLGLPELGCATSLVLVPHGFLHYLPFHALYDGEQYLLERCAISYAPSATVYNFCRSRKPWHGGTPLVLADSAAGRLPFTYEEADSVAAVLGTTAHTGSAATRALLESAGKRASVIHIAAHGRFRADAPMFSTIELADGPLTAADVFSLNLRANLVTLSACETGRSEVGGGDELVGLIRAFLYAGAGGLVVSQWRVEDASTFAIMKRFYEELSRGAGRASALRTGQIEALRRNVLQNARQHPFFWAGFQVIGDDRGIG